MPIRIIAILLGALLSARAWAASVTEPTTLVRYNASWSFWIDDKAPPGWPLPGGPGAAGNALQFLPELIEAEQVLPPLYGTAQGDTDRVLPLNNGRGGLLTSGTWFNGFHAPFSARSEQRWLRYAASWKKEKDRNRRKKRRPFSRSNLVYPTDLPPDAAPGKYGSASPEPGPAAMYFAKRFQVKDASAIRAFRVQARFKKGVTIYINGKQVLRDRISEGAAYGDYGYTPRPSASWIRNDIRGSNRWETQRHGMDPSILKTGMNTITAVVHKSASGGSPGMYFDAQVKAYTRMGFTKTPYLHRVTKDGVTVSWETTAKSYGKVTITDEAGAEVGEFKSARRGVFHEVQIRGLQPDTRYFYKVSSGVSSSPLSFVTAPTDDAPFSFLLYGDSRYGVRVHKPLAELMAADADRYGSNLVVHTGDIVSKGYEWDLWQERFFKPASPLISQVPIYTVPGNHELNAKLYYDYFDLPNNEAWYHFRYGLADFYGVNTNVGFGPKSAQYKWLDAELAKSKAAGEAWRIVFMHHPPFACATSRKPGSRNVTKYLVPLFEKHGVHLVLLGHDHLYGRSANINGVHYVISGGGGSSLYRCKPDERMVVCERRYNYVRFHVDQTQIRWVATDEKGVIIEEYAIGE